MYVGSGAHRVRALAVPRVGGTGSCRWFLVGTELRTSAGAIYTLLTAEPYLQP